MRTLVSLLLIFLSATFLNAQDVFVITGKVFDSKTKKPVAFANIGLPKQGIGTTSADDGSFLLKVPKAFREQTIRVSYIGYSVYRRKASEIQNPTTIYLQQQATELTEVVVTGKNDAKDIIRTAIDRVEKNYPTYPTNVLAFYRESMTDDKGEYEYLAEGVMHVYKDSYMSTREGDVELVQARKMNLKNPLDTTLNAQFSSGHMAGQRFDIVKNREDFFRKKFLKAYNYKLESATLIDGRPTWVIRFEKNQDFTPKTQGNRSFFGMLFGRKGDVVKARMQGLIYIDQEDYALVRTEFEITPDGLTKINDYPLYAGSWKGNYYVVNYNKINDKWHFHDALREGTYAGRQIYTNEVLITENDGSKGKKIEYLNRMSRGGYFVNNTVSYDDDFWSSYNTTPLNSKLKESVQQMNNSLKSEEIFDPEKMKALQELRDSTALAERLAELEEQQGDLGDLSEDELKDLLPEKVILNEGNERETRARFNFGLGSHFFQPSVSNMRVNFLTDDLTTTILSAEGELPQRTFEVIAFYDFDVYLSKRLFLRFGAGGDFYNNIHKEGNIGVGLNLDLSKGRPVNLRLLAQHSRIRHARKVGQAENTFGNFDFDKKRYNSDKINVYYGSRTHNAKLSAELSIERFRHQSIFVRASYYLPFARRQDVWFWERGQIFRRKRHIPADTARFEITSNGETFLGQVVQDASFSITVGMTFH